MNEINGKDLVKLGFKLVKSYYHDRYKTRRFAKGFLEVELTYEDEVLISCDLTISELFCKTTTLDELKVLTPILGESH